MMSDAGPVPKLRFPEFRNASCWEEKRLNQISTSIFDGTHQTPTYTESGVPFFSVENIVSGKLNKFISRADYLLATKNHKPEEGDILITRIGNIGHSAIVDWSYDFSIYVTLAVVKQDERFNSRFLHCYFQSGRYRAEILSRSLPNAVPQKINMDELRKSVVLLPLPAEQQEIADCLTSVDDLITAEAQKLEALKDHKKGLMQQLFPREGEPKPRLRFPEFRDAGDWKEKSLGVCLSQHPDYGKNAPAVPYSEDLPTYLRITDISDEGRFVADQKVSVAQAVCEDDYLQDGDIALARTGASVGKSYRHKNANGKLVFAGFLIRVRTDESRLFSELLIHFLSTAKYWRWVDFISARSGQPGINGHEYAALPVPLPPSLEEQQKIADCLTSVDDLITAETQKFEALKDHKKGLMQQLFPASDEVNG